MQGLDDQFAEMFSGFLETNTTLTEVNLESNDIMGIGFKAFARCLLKNTSLRTLKLRNQR